MLQIIPLQLICSIVGYIIVFMMGVGLLMCLERVTSGLAVLIIADDSAQTMDCYVRDILTLNVDETNELKHNDKPTNVSTRCC